MALRTVDFKHSGWRCSHSPTGLGGLHNTGRRLHHPHPLAPPHTPHQAQSHGSIRSRTLPCHASAHGPSSPGNLNLYGSRTAIGRQLLQHLLQASPPPPDTDFPTGPQPQTPIATLAGRAPGPWATEEADRRGHVAAAQPPHEALEHVESLVRYVEGLMLVHRDMQQLQAAMERCAHMATAGTGGGSGGMSSSSRFGGGSRGGFFGASRPARSAATEDGGIGSSSSSSSSIGGGGGSGSPGAGGEVAARPPWSWAGVQRLVVVGLGSLAAYRAAIGSGRQTERESSRAAARLYQLALSRVLASPLLLPGLAHSPAGSEAGTPAHLSYGVSYYDPEYLPWDVQLLQRLWASGQMPGPEPACAATLAAAPEDVSPGLGAPAAARDGGGGASRPACSAVHVQPSVLGGAALVAHVPTLFYCPCCPRDVYDAVVRANQAAGTLHNVAIIGNSFRGQADAALLLRAFGGLGAGMGPGRGPVGGGMGGGAGGRAGGRGLGAEGLNGGLGAGAGEGKGEVEGEEAFVQLVAEGKVVELMLPDFAAHGVATALHLFF